MHTHVVLLGLTSLHCLSGVTVALTTVRHLRTKTQEAVFFRAPFSPYSQVEGQAFPSWSHISYLSLPFSLHWWPDSGHLPHRDPEAAAVECHIHPIHGTHTVLFLSAKASVTRISAFSYWTSVAGTLIFIYCPDSELPYSGVPSMQYKASMLKLFVSLCGFIYYQQ